MRKPLAFLFRAFFPSWRFFEDLGEIPILSYRFAKDGSELGAWQEFRRTVPRRRFGLFFNPEAGAKLACGSLLQHLLAEIEETDEKNPSSLASSIPYQLTQNLVLSELYRFEITEKAKYQFKLASLTTGTAGSRRAQTDVLISPVYEVQCS